MAPIGYTTSRALEALPLMPLRSGQINAESNNANSNSFATTSAMTTARAPGAPTASAVVMLLVSQKLRPSDEYSYSDSQFTESRSTTKISVSADLIQPPSPPPPHARRDGRDC